MEQGNCIMLNKADKYASENFITMLGINLQPADGLSSHLFHLWGNKSKTHTDRVNIFSWVQWHLRGCYKWNKQRFLMQYTMELSQTFVSQKKYTGTNLKRQYENNPYGLSICNNLAVFYFYSSSLAWHHDTLWYAVFKLQAHMSNVKASYWKKIYSWLINYLSRLQIVNVRFINTQHVQAVFTQASQASHKVMQSRPEWTQVYTGHRWHISVYHHNNV